MSALRKMSVASIAALLALAGCASEDIELPRTPWQSKAEPPRPLKEEPPVRVRVVVDAPRVTLDGSRASELILVRPAGGGVGYQLTGPFTIQSGPSGIAVAGSDRRARSFPPGTDLEITALPAAGAAGVIRVDGVPRTGVLTVRPDWANAPGRFDVVESLGLEAFLPEALASEAGATPASVWPRGALEAQAVAIRSRLLSDRQRALTAKRSYDCDSDKSVPPAAPTSQMRLATESTRGMVIFDEAGQPVRAVMSPVCGGRPASAADVWPSGPGFEYNKALPLQAAVRVHDCSPAPHYRWTITRPTEDVSLRLRAWASSADHPLWAISRVRSIEVTTRSTTQRPVFYRVTDEQFRRYEIRAQQLRIALNYPVSGAAGISQNPGPVWSDDLEIQVNVSDVRIDGRGEGHGVGLCQWCSKGMAERGVSWRDMIANFYPGSQVSRAY